MFDASARVELGSISVYNYANRMVSAFTFKKNMSIASIFNYAGIYSGTSGSVYFKKVDCDYTATIMNKYRHYLRIGENTLKNLFVNADISDLVFFENMSQLGDKSSIDVLTALFTGTHPEYTSQSLYLLYIFEYKYSNYKSILSDLNLKGESISLAELGYRSAQDGYTLTQLQYEYQSQIAAQQTLILAYMGYQIADALVFGTNKIVWSERSSLDQLEKNGYLTPTQKNALVGKYDGKTPVIGRMSDLNASGKVNNNTEYCVADLLPDQGGVKANWDQNSGVLRSVMNQGKPIKDVSVFNATSDPKLGIIGTGNENTFLHMERNLLYENGWRY